MTNGVDERPPLTDAEHVLNLCTIAAGIMAGTRLQSETVGDDAVVVYDRVLVSYKAAMYPTPVAAVGAEPAEEQEPVDPEV